MTPDDIKEIRDDKAKQKDSEMAKRQGKWTKRMMWTKTGFYIVDPSGQQAAWLAEGTGYSVRQCSALAGRIKRLLNEDDAKNTRRKRKKTSQALCKWRCVRCMADQSWITRDRQNCLRCGADRSWLEQVNASKKANKSKKRKKT